MERAGLGVLLKTVLTHPNRHTCRCIHSSTTPEQESESMQSLGLHELPGALKSGMCIGMEGSPPV